MTNKTKVDGLNSWLEYSIHLGLIMVIFDIVLCLKYIRGIITARSRVCVSRLIVDGWWLMQQPETRIENRESRIANRESRIENWEFRVESWELRIENWETRNQKQHKNKREPESKYRIWGIDVPLCVLNDSSISMGPHAVERLMVVWIMIGLWSYYCE